MPHDLFISYSRRDDKQGQVRALKEQIEADYRSFAKEDLRCFFDRKPEAWSWPRCSDRRTLRRRVAAWPQIQKSTVFSAE
jgi:hypothetical protein